MVRTAASRSAAVRSGSFALAISSSCLRVTLPTFSVLGRLDPDCPPAAFFSSILAGGDLVMKLQVRSVYAVIPVGMCRPGSKFCVAACHALQNARIFSHPGPRDEPRGTRRL